jgi:integrase
MMSEAGIPRFTVARVLGHTDGSVTAIYDRNAYRAEKREALERLAQSVQPRPENVVALHG